VIFLAVMANLVCASDKQAKDIIDGRGDYVRTSDECKGKHGKFAMDKPEVLKCHSRW
jgi:hypothetical protein